MKKKSKWLLIITLLLLFVVATFLWWNASKKEDEPKEKPADLSTNIDDLDKNTATLDTISDAPYKVSVPKKAHVFVIRNNRVKLYSDDKLDVTTGTFKDKLPKNTRFILLSDEQTLSNEEKTQLQTWVKEKKFVLFFGSDVKADYVLNTLHIKKESVNVQSNVDLYQAVYGYGYWHSYRAEFPLFLWVNSTDSNSLSSNIARFIYEKRGI